MSSVKCPKDDCDYEASEHGVKIHVGQKHNINEYSCDFCGEKFSRSPSKVREEQNIFCSDSCKNEYRTGKNNPNGTNSLSFKCSYCGETNSKPVSIVKRGQEHRYCDTSCQNEHWREEKIQSGEDNPMYGGEGSAWRSRHQWKNAKVEVLERDGHQCVWCENDENLHVHHIVPVFAGGEKYELSNLQTLCEGCHKRVHKRIDVIYSRR
jgi:5-methylcytosine-specific restriction endonuclease McrA